MIASPYVIIMIRAPESEKSMCQEIDKSMQIMEALPDMGHVMSAPAQSVGLVHNSVAYSQHFIQNSNQNLMEP
jgi:hypothetical protein